MGVMVFMNPAYPSATAESIVFASQVELDFAEFGRIVIIGSSVSDTMSVGAGSSVDRAGTNG
jgi:hypothetical protein